jgi:anti-sigma regulatory factor (Ser/Thr protein kinase)
MLWTAVVPSELFIGPMGSDGMSWLKRGGEMTEQSQRFRLANPPEWGDRVRRLLTSAGWSEADTDDTQGAVELSCNAEIDIKQAINRGCKGLIQLDGNTSEADIIAEYKLACSQPILFSLFTASACDTPITEIICNNYRPLSSLEGEKRENIELALHEAVSNAIVHGNLQVKSVDSVSVEALGRFAAEMAERLADPVYARRRLRVVLSEGTDAIDASVDDEGPGFVPKPSPTGTAPSGRGIELIRTLSDSMRIANGGRRIELTFQK